MLALGANPPINGAQVPAGTAPVEATAKRPTPPGDGVKPSGDTIKLTCTYDPTLRQKLPQLRSQAPRFITWGDGSSDEMCLGLIMTVPKKPANA